MFVPLMLFRAPAGVPLIPGLTEHGQRHAHQTMMDDLNIRYVLQAERMGHEVPGMRGVYKHIAPEWRTDLVDGLQRLWEMSLDNRIKISRRSSVPLLDRVLADRLNYGDSNHECAGR